MSTQVLVKILLAHYLCTTRVLLEYYLSTQCLPRASSHFVNTAHCGCLLPQAMRFTVVFNPEVAACLRSDTPEPERYVSGDLNDMADDYAWLEKDGEEGGEH